MARVALLVIAVVWGAAYLPAAAGDDPFLSALEGTWQMRGSVGAKPVQYYAQGVWVLERGFLLLHMASTNATGPTPPDYEARVYIGYDAKASDYVAHWLDRFGAAGARVVATGKRDGDKLVIVFPYAEGAFRDTFTLHRAAHGWDLLIEAQKSDGSWSTFATYTATPAAN